MAWLVAPQRRLEVLTIIKRGEALGMLAHGDREDVFTRGRAELRGLIQIAFGGQVSEELFFGDVSTGPAGDLAYATQVAAQMVGAAGMAGLVGLLRRGARHRLHRHRPGRQGARRRQVPGAGRGAARRAEGRHPARCSPATATS